MYLTRTSILFSLLVCVACVHKNNESDNDLENHVTKTNKQALLKQAQMCAQSITAWDPTEQAPVASSLLSLLDPISRPMDVVFGLNKKTLNYNDLRNRLLTLMSKKNPVKENSDPENADINLMLFTDVPSELVTFVAAQLKLVPYPGNTTSVASLEDINIEAALRSGITKLVRTFGVRGRGVKIAMHEVGKPQGSHEDMLASANNYRQEGAMIDSNTLSAMPKEKSNALCAMQKKPTLIRNTCHATHVMGTLAASGNSGAAIGMASESVVIAAPPLDEKTWGHTKWADAQVGNHSYGYGCKSAGNCYSPQQLEFIFKDLQAAADQAAINGDHLAIFAAGNNRKRYIQNLFPCGGDTEPFGTIAAGGTAKNTLTVGSLEDSAVLRVSSFSNVGPTFDGRLKPEVVANGESLYSIGVAPQGDFVNARYQSMGTSMAAPVVTGAGALLQELARVFREDGKFLTSYGLRTALIHGACALPTNANNSTPGICQGADKGPNYISGFGEINAFVSGCAVANIHAGLVDEQILEPGQSKVFTLTRSKEALVSSGEIINNRARRECFKERDISVTLTWLDEPGQTLLNDLDIRLTSPTGEIIEPWSLDPWNPSQRAVRGDNSKDSVEKITLSSKMANEGTWLVEVSSKPNVSSPVKFSVAWTGLQKL